MILSTTSVGEKGDIGDAGAVRGEMGAGRKVGTRRKSGVLEEKEGIGGRKLMLGGKGGYQQQQTANSSNGQ